MRSLTSTPLAPTFQYSTSGTMCTCWTNSPASMWNPRSTVLLAPSGSTKPIRAPSPRNPRPWLVVDAGGAAAWARAPKERRPAATMSAPTSDPFRFIAETPSVVVYGPCIPGLELAGDFFRNENSSECSPRQLEHEAKPSVEGEPVEVDFLTNHLPQARIEDVGLG